MRHNSDGGRCHIEQIMVRLVGKKDIEPKELKFSDIFT